MKNKKQLFRDLYLKIQEQEIFFPPSEIKAIRRQYGLTQVSFAEKLNVSYGTYKNWEIGHRIPSSPAMALLYVAKHYPKIFKNLKESTL